MVQVLDAEGKVVNPDLVPDLSDDELVELMTEWYGLVFYTNVQLH